jgi:hypothetical protein
VGMAIGENRNRDLRMPSGMDLDTSVCTLDLVAIHAAYSHIHPHGIDVDPSDALLLLFF